MSDTLIGLLVLTALIVAYVIPVVMADKRERSMVGWFIITLIISPFWAIIALLVLGKDES